jgi:phage-related tail fiber protein
MQKISWWTDLVAAFGRFRYGSLTAGVPPTPVKAEWLNMVQEEMTNLVLAYLPALDAADNAQVLKALQKAIELSLVNYAFKATTLGGYGIGDAYTKAQTDLMLSGKANNAITLGGYGIGDAYTKTQTDLLLSGKANNANSLAGYGIGDAYRSVDVDWLLASKANNAITLAGYGIGDAYTKDAIHYLLSIHRELIDNLAATKQDKNTALMAANGWRLDKATGLLEQWGTGYCPPDTTTAPINFPTAFAEVYNCFGNKINTNSVDGDGNAAGAFATNETQYQLFNDTNLMGVTVHWRALGRAPGY